MLMEDGGQTLRQLVEVERDLSRWNDVLPLYAGVQIDLAGDVAELLAIGVPDFRLASLPTSFEAVLDQIVEQPDEERRRLRASVPWVREACDELAAAGLPETIQHDDLHDAQIFVRDDRYLLLDWGDACVSHPFFTPGRDPRRRHRLGRRRRGGVGADGAVPRRLSGAVPRAHDRATSPASRRRRDGWAGSAARSTVVARSRRTRARGCGSGCSSTAAHENRVG